MARLPRVVSPEVGICTVRICLGVARVKCSWGSTSLPQVGTVSLQAVASPQMAFLLQPGLMCYQDSELCMVQAASSCPASIMEARDGLLGRGDGAGSPTCLQNHLNGLQRDTSKDSVRTAALDGDHQCQQLLVSGMAPA